MATRRRYHQQLERLERQRLRVAVALFLGVIAVVYFAGEVNALLR